jgi:hypothetical protein
MVIHLVQMLQLQTGGICFHIFVDRFYTSHQLAVELHEMEMQTIVTNLIPTNADEERGEKPETHLAGYKNLIAQLTGNVADRNAR